ncbi:MAG: hypothetical protein L3J82_00715, partial [Planctomycetes bacterium]|nr:hypothetical protein [Planctomycetota bacterium]
MPWKEVLKILLKQKLTMVCLFIILISVFFAVTAGFFVSDIDLQSNPKVDDIQNLRRFETSRLSAENEQTKPENADAEIKNAVAVNKDSLTNMERAYHPPGWWLAMNTDHDHWTKTGKNEDGKNNPAIATKDRNWEFFGSKAWRFPMGCTDEGIPVHFKLLRGLRLAFIIGLIPTLISSIIAVFMGLTAGYFGRLIDDAIFY